MRYVTTAMHIPAPVILAIVDRFTENDRVLSRPTTVKVHDNWVIVENTACMTPEDPGCYVMRVENDDIDEIVTIHTGWLAEPTIRVRYNGTLIEE